MSDSDSPAPASESPARLNVLLIDESDADRDHLYTILSAVITEAGAIHQAASVEGAWDIAQTLDHLEAVIGGIPETNGESIFDLRDKLVGRFGPVSTAFCSAADMTPYYDRVEEGEMLFFKPVDDDVMRDWLTDHTGLALSGDGAGAGAGVDATVGPPAESGGSSESAAVDEDQEESAAPESGPADAREEPEPPGEPDGPIPGPNDELPEGRLPVGTQLGDYRLISIIQSDNDLAMYEAEQTSIGRRVALKTLYRKHRKDPEWVGMFAHEARSRALVSHPNISLVYEADQDRGLTYYTLELINGPTLAQLAEAQETLSDAILWRIAKAAADILLYLRANEMEHRMLSADTIFVVGEGQPRIANPVKPGIPLPEEDSAQMRLIAEALRPFVRQGRTDKRLITLIDRMSNPARVDGIKSAHGLSEAIRQLEDQALQPVAPEIIEKRNNRAAVISGVVVGALILVGGLIWQVFFGSRPVAKEFDTMIRVPDGAFVYQDGKKVELPAFWIDEYEVTIGQYAEFLAALEADSTLASKVRHPRQPEAKTSHEPRSWDDYYETAIRGGNISGADIDPNCPVINLDWWDAYAYARWKGNRLPSEQEWEKAARGPAGSVFPWGDEVDLARFNSGIDQDPQSNGNKDGFRYWAPVDHFSSDQSQYGVRGMAGNVSEWTDTWDTDPDDPEQQVPIKRGASFATKEGFELTSRRPAKNADEATLWTGFRTARSEAPLPPGTPPPPLEPVAPAAGDTNNAPAMDNPGPDPAPSPGEPTTPGAPPTPAPDGSAPPSPSPAPEAPAPAPPGAPADTPAPAPQAPSPEPQ